MPNLTINGIPIEVPDGTTVLRAVEMAGITIPTLCDHPHLTPYGGCRLCVVDVKGMRLPAASCTLPVNNGMVVETETPALVKSRKVILGCRYRITTTQLTTRATPTPSSPSGSNSTASI